MRSMIYWAAWNVAAYLTFWCLYCIFGNLEPVPKDLRDKIGGPEFWWTGQVAPWPVQVLPWVLLAMAAVNIIVFAANRPLGEDCGGGKG